MALVIRGEAGIGKTALLQSWLPQAVGCRVVQIAGIESELALPFAAIHQLCEPMLSELVKLPEPQERALQVAFGLTAGDPSDRFVVGLAVLGLLSEVAAERPLICLVDDAQWLDEASAQVLGFVSRRLLAECVLLLLAVREPAEDRLFPGLPDLTLHGLTDEDARALLAVSVPGQLDEHVRDRIVAETRGNPLALLELPRGMSSAELAGGFSTPVSPAVSGQLNEHYLRLLRTLPEPTQELMLLAAADPTGDAPLLWRAAQFLGIPRTAAAAAADERLLEIDSRVRFRHPLVRSTAYAMATPGRRSAAHLALASATNIETQPEHRVWHLAAAATDPDDEIAAELEQSAARVQARAGLAAAAAFLQRSVALTADVRRRADRALAAARAHLHAGAFRAALGLLAEAEADAVDDLQRARVEQLRGQVESAANPGREAPVRLLRAARTLESLDAQLARETYLEAWRASLVAGALALPGGHLLEVSEAARSLANPSQTPDPLDALLTGLTTLIIDGAAKAAPSLREAVNAFLEEHISNDNWIQLGHMAQLAAIIVWDVDSWISLSRRQAELARASGALAPLYQALNGRALVASWSGDLETATGLVAEIEAVREATGIRLYSSAGLMLAAYRGRSAEASRLIAATTTESIDHGEGIGLQHAAWAAAVLNNGLGRYAEALTAAQEIGQASELHGSFFSAAWALPELVEAAARTENPALARKFLRSLEAAALVDSEWALGMVARCRALVADRAAEQHYVEAIERFTRTPLRPDLARAHLLYGEWLRRERRRSDARKHLRIAYDMLVGIGAEAFTERTRWELLATGETVRKREVDTYTQLTPQEEHIARLARDGRTNPEIGAELFLSARTVEWHLSKVFAKLGISSRRGLHTALPPLGRFAVSVAKN